MSRTSWHVIALAILAAVAAPASAADEKPAGKLDYARDVRPVLASNCFKCHGVDDKARKAKLRLDVREDALAERPESGRAVVPGKPDESELVRRILSDDP